MSRRPAAALLRYGVLAVGVTVAGAASVAGQPPSERGGQRADRLSARAEGRLRELRAQAAELTTRERTLSDEIRLLEIDREIKSEELAAIDADLDAMTGQLEDAEQRIAELEAEAARQRPLVEARLVELYKMGRPGARLLFGAGDLRSLGRVSRLIATLSRRDQERFETHRRTVADLEAARAVLAERQSDIARMRVGARNARRAADRAVTTQRARLDQIATERDLATKLADELEAARQRLETTRAAPADGAAAPEPVVLPLAPFRGRLAPPVSGPVRIPYGVARAAGAGLEQAGAGIELAAARGESVRAVHGGVVRRAETIDGLGTVVVLDHGNGNATIYAYLATRTVQPGARVEHGAVLGTAGAAPGGAPGLYFELRVDGASVDPVEWLE